MFDFEKLEREYPDEHDRYEILKLVIMRMDGETFPDVPEEEYSITMKAGARFYEP